jgi:hypothetical protein
VQNHLIVSSGVEKIVKVSEAQSCFRVKKLGELTWKIAKKSEGLKYRNFVPIFGGNGGGVKNCAHLDGVGRS